MLAMVACCVLAASWVGFNKFISRPLPFGRAGGRREKKIAAEMAVGRMLRELEIVQAGRQADDSRSGLRPGDGSVPAGRVRMEVESLFAEGTSLASRCTSRTCLGRPPRSRSRCRQPPGHNCGTHRRPIAIEHLFLAISCRSASLWFGSADSEPPHAHQPESNG